jgi:hypothetical protein
MQANAVNDRQAQEQSINSLTFRHDSLSRKSRRRFTVFSVPPAAAVTAHAAAEAEASAGLGAARLPRKETKVAPIQTFFLTWVFETCEPC